MTAARRALFGARVTRRRTICAAERHGRPNLACPRHSKTQTQAVRMPRSLHATRQGSRIIRLRVITPQQRRSLIFPLQTSREVRAGMRLYGLTRLMRCSSRPPPRPCAT